MRLPRLPLLVLPALAFVALTAPACVDPAASRPVLAQQHEALTRLQRVSAEDLEGLSALADALLAVQRERLLTAIELNLAANTLDAQGDPPPDADAPVAQYAALLRAGASVQARRAPLEALPDVRAFDDSADAFRAALNTRARAADALLAQALADNEALADAAGASLDLSDASREAASLAWRDAVLNTIDDPAQRAAAQRLLDNLLNPSN